MLHHSSSDYDEAASHAAKVGRQKMEDVIHRGLASAEAVVAQIQNSHPVDRLVRSSDLKLNFFPDDEGRGGEFYLQSGYRSDETNRIHPHAMSQLMGGNGVNLGMDFVNKIHTESKGLEWGHEIIQRAVNEILSHRPPADRNLVRVDPDSEKVKGFLSDKFRRLDSRPLFDAFMGMATQAGLVPIEGVASDTKHRLRAILPKVFEPVRNEVMVFGLELGNSDYGDGGLCLNLWVMRMLCTNLAVAQKGLRQIHVGRQISEDLSLSREWYEADTKATALKIRDIGHGLIGPGPVNRMLSAVASASEEEIKSADGIDKYLRTLGKGEAAVVKGLYEGPDNQNLPEGRTVYRLSNAVSFFAQYPGTGADRRLELQDLAGKIMVPQASEKSLPTA